VREQERHLGAVTRRSLEEAVDEQTCVAGAMVRRFNEHRADAADAHRVAVEDSRQVVLLGAGEELAAVDQGKRPLAPAAPGRLHRGRVKAAVRVACQCEVRGPAPGVEDAIEERPVSGNELDA
jgi:hypothetical protein